jgi:hypothetical protein
MEGMALPLGQVQREYGGFLHESSKNATLDAPGETL